MSYKTILVHLVDELHAEGLLRATRPLAEAHGAHLIGLSVLPLVDAPSRKDTTVDELLRQYQSAMRSEAARIEAIFKAPGPVAAYTSEWRLADTGFERASDAIARHGSAADIIVVSQDDPSWQSSGLMRDSAGLIGLLAGRPVLVIPHGREIDQIGGRVLVAWNASRESARAVFDALPLLKRASMVTVLCVQSPDAADNQSISGFQPGEDICSALTRHGVKCELKVEPPLADGTAATLLSAVERHKAQLLVMGDYGRSRLSEFIFGGATRSVLREMTIPILLSH